MTWRAPPFAEDRIPPSHPHPFDGQAGTFGGATRGVGMTSAPGPGEKRPRKCHGWGVEVEFHCCIFFESVCDKDFTNQSALFSLFPFPLRGNNSQTAAPPAPFVAIAVDDILHRLSPTD